MSWAKFDDSFPEHPKVLGLSDRAFRMFVTAVCYSARHLTDGVVPESVLLANGRGGALRALDGLLASGLLTQGEDLKFRIHDYLDYNPSREKVLAERKAAADRQERFRNGGGHASRNGVTNASPSPPLPDPLPNPTDSVDRRARERHKPVDEEFIGQMVEEFRGRLDEPRIRRELATAQNRRQWDDYKDKRRHFHDWLERASTSRSPAPSGQPYGGSYRPGSMATGGGGRGAAEGFGDAPAGSIRADDGPFAEHSGAQSNGREPSRDSTRAEPW